MSGWADVVTTALLGTDRRPLPADLPEPWGRLSHAGPAIEHGSGAFDPASTLLDLSAAHRAVSRGGSPLASCPAPARGPVERLPRAPEPAQTLLGSLLTKPQPGLLNSWMAACTARGEGAGDEHWTRLAGVAARATAVDRELLRQVLGPRGVWLLSQQPQWNRLTAPAAPSGGLSTVAVAEPAPDTARRQQMAELAMTAVTVAPLPGSGALTVIVQPPVPETTGPAPASADGVHALLTDLVAATALGAWTAHTGLGPTALVRLARRTAGIWADPLCSGWARAAQDERDEDWAVALLEAGYVGAEDSALCRLVPVERRQALALSWARGGNRPVRALEMMLSCPDPWPVEVAAAAVDLLAAGAFATNTREVAVLVGQRLPLDVLPDLADRMQAHATGESRLSTSMFLLVRQGFTALEQVLAFRTEIAEAFATDDSPDTADRNASSGGDAGTGRI